MTRRYFDLAADGYSFAEFASERGFLVAGVDHPGVGDSDAPDDGWTLTPEAVASIEAAAVGRMLALLRAGDVPGVPALDPGVPVIGVGHSAGAHLLIHQFALLSRDNSKINTVGPNGPAISPRVQAISGPRYDGLALLGWAGRGLPEYLDEADATLADLDRCDPGAFARELVASRRN